MSVDFEPWQVFLLLALATYRLSMLIAVEKGPARLLSKFRKLPPHKSSAREGLSCPHCVGIYMAGLAAGVLLWLQALDWKIFPLFWLSLAGASSFMVRVGRAPD